MVAIFILICCMGDCQKHSKVLYVVAFYFYGLVSTLLLVTLISLVIPGAVDAATSSNSTSAPEVKKLPDIHRYDTVEDLSAREQYTVMEVRGYIVEIKRNGSHVILRMSDYEGEYFDDYGHRHRKV